MGHAHVVIIKIAGRAGVGAGAVDSPETLFALIMERLFSPCTRMYDILESQGRCNPSRIHPELLQELNLNVSTEELLSVERAFTYTNLYAMLGNRNTVAWLTPHAFITRCHTTAVFFLQFDDYRFSLNVDGVAILAVARSLQHVLEICDVILRLLAASIVHSLIFQKSRSLEEPSICAITLAYLLERCQSLKVLSLTDLVLDENHCRVLGAYSRPDLEINLVRCTLTSAGTSALAEVLRRNQGPTKLVLCESDALILANGLRENSRLESWRLDSSSSNDRDAGYLLAIAAALKENKGLIDLDLSALRSGRFRVDNETWDVVCDSLKTHPTLQVLSFHSMGPFVEVPPSPALLKSRMQALLDMVKVNMSIHTIRPPHRDYREHKLFREAVIPYLVTNRFRPRVRAIQKTRPIPYRAKLLGRALLAARTDTNSFWMLLSGNAEVAFPSTAATTIVAANLATPAAAAATATSNVAAPVLATATVPVTATRTASTTGASAAANVAPPIACQKRKARP
jgi:hypothetical protein